MTTKEADAVMADAEKRLAELYAIRGALLPDRDDPHVLSELTSIDSQIRSAETALRR